MPAVDWIIITSEDLDDFLVGAQVSAIRTKALAAGQDDPFEEVREAITNRIRAEVQACSRNQISATALSIPPELKAEAVYLILEALQRRLPTLKLTEDQKKAADEARAYLKRIANCDVPITTPSDPLEEGNVQQGAPAQIVSSSTRIATREMLRGL